MPTVMEIGDALKVDHVSKKFCKSLNRSMRYGLSDIGKNLLGMSTNPGILREDEFFAVNDVTFDVKKGDTFGIVGLNGSGKSTLLKMINGIYKPDKGKISVRGRVGALIEVGAGFHRMLTGRENVYLNATIYGMSKKDVDKKFDDIVDFAEIGEFIDTPVKQYSVGMYIRLGFSVAIHCEPDILLVDEVLSVGDSRFVEKCQERISRMLANGMTLILVSHNMRLITAMCSRAMLIYNGRQIGYADSNSIVHRYEELALEKKNIDTELNAEGSCKRYCVFSDHHITDEYGNELEVFPIGGKISYSFIYALHPSLDPEKVLFSLGLMKDQERYNVASYSNVLDGFKLSKSRGRMELTMDLNATSGVYQLHINFSYGETKMIATYFTRKFKVMHPSLPMVSREYFGHFLLKPEIRIYPMPGPDNMKT